MKIKELMREANFEKAKAEVLSDICQKLEALSDLYDRMSKREEEECNIEHMEHYDLLKHILDNASVQVSFTE